MGPRSRATLLALAFGLLGAAAPAATPTATPTPPPRLRLDVDRHVRELLEPRVPRFEVEVVTRTPQQAFEEHLQGFNTTCGPSSGGAPTVADLAPHRPQGPPALFSVDILKLIEDLKKSGPDRYFLYKMTKQDDGAVTYLVNEGRLPWPRLTPPGAVLEPIAAFPDRGTATRAVRRLERGYRTAVYQPPPRCGGEPEPGPHTLQVPTPGNDRNRTGPY